jgi:O-antigen ligase
MKSLILIIALLIALSSATTTAPGILWILIFLLGSFIVLTQRTTMISLEKIEQNQYTQIAKHWVWFCLAAGILIAIPTTIWGGPWSERHPQIRLLIAAIGVYGITLFPNARLAHLKLLSTCFALGITANLIIAFLGTAWLGSATFAPTNRIPWMAGISVLTCAALAFAYADQRLKNYHKIMIIGCAAITMITALYSGVRGSWPLIFVLLISLFFLQKTNSYLDKKTAIFCGGASSIALIIFTLLPGGTETPWPRLQLAAYELLMVGQDSNSGKSFDSSIGIRAGMYISGFENAPLSGWFGIGHEAHKQQLFETFTKLGVPHFSSQLGHYHNDALNAWVEFGIFGLISYFTYSIGIAYLAIRLSKSHKACSIGLWSIMTMHLLTGMSNMNFAHNYYPLMLSLSIALLLLTAWLNDINTKHHENTAGS